MAITKTLLKAIAMDGRSPQACLTYVNTLLYPQSLPEMFVTSCYGILDTQTGQFEYTTAGHFPPYIIRKGGNVEMLPFIRSVGLCMMKDFQFESNTTTLQRGDSIFLYTDGLDEATRIDGQQFTQENIELALQETTSFSAQERVSHLIKAVKNFTDEAPQSDDLTLLTLSFI